jgi:hypothetical protein
MATLLDYRCVHGGFLCLFFMSWSFQHDSVEIPNRHQAPQPDNRGQSTWK